MAKPSEQDSHRRPLRVGAVAYDPKARDDLGGI